MNPCQDIAFQTALGLYMTILRHELAVHYSDETVIEFCERNLIDIKTFEKRIMDKFLLSNGTVATIIFTGKPQEEK